MNGLSIRAGTMSAGAFERWLCSDEFKRWSDKRKLYALLEYMHRFKFTDREGFYQDIGKKETADYSLRGRIFWEDGQIEWRRVDKGTFCILVLEEDGTRITLPKGFASVENTPPDVKTCENTTIVLWGAYNPKIEGFLERRVSGSEPIEYPDVFTDIIKRRFGHSSSNKREVYYPIIHVRIYKDAEGEPQFWRFVRPDARTPEDWEREGGV